MRTRMIVLRGRFATHHTRSRYQLPARQFITPIVQFIVFPLPFPLVGISACAGHGFCSSIRSVLFSCQHYYYTSMYLCVTYVVHVSVCIERFEIWLLVSGSFACASVYSLVFESQTSIDTFQTVAIKNHFSTSWIICKSNFENFCTRIQFGSKFVWNW